MRRICLVGPADPAQILGHTRVSVGVPTGMGGTPVNNLAIRLLELGYELDVVSASPHISQPWGWQDESLCIRVVPWRSSAKRRALTLFRSEIALLSRAVSSSTADVVHAHWTYEFALASLQASRPVVVSAHDDPFAILKHHQDVYRVVRFAMALRVGHMCGRKNVQVVPVSPSIEPVWRRLTGSTLPLPIVTNGVAQPPRREPQDLAKPLIVTIGNDDRLKNISALVHAARHFPREVDLVFIGPGLNQHSDFAKWARGRGASCKLSFMGVLSPSQVGGVLDRATLMVHPSLQESQGMAISEALARGVPVIAGKESGAVPWTLNNGAAGLLIDVTDPGKIAEAVNRLLTDGGVRASLSVAGLEHFARVFDITTTTTNYLTLYEEAIRQWGDRARFGGR